MNFVYSSGNRSAAISIPVTGSSPKAKRLEFRVPDPSSNPYLAFAVAPDGAVYALARLTTNIYRVDADSLTPIARPHDEVENILLDLTEDGRFVGVAASATYGPSAPDEDAEVFSLTATDFAYPDEVQSMLLHSRGQRLWVGAALDDGAQPRGADLPELLRSRASPRPWCRALTGRSMPASIPARRSWPTTRAP